MLLYHYVNDSSCISALDVVDKQLCRTFGTERVVLALCFSCLHPFAGYFRLKSSQRRWPSEIGAKGVSNPFESDGVTLNSQKTNFSF